MVSLLNALQLQIVFIALTDSFLATFLISRFSPPQLSLAVIDCTLLGLHLFVDGKEFCSFLRCQTSLPGDKLLQVGLELLRRELLLRLRPEPLCRDHQHQGKG